MKLAMIQLVTSVPAGSPGNSTARLAAADGPGPGQGWDLVADYDKRVVFASKADRKLVIPFENAPWMEPLAAVAKAVKGAA